jgi:hypothetical protein
MTSSASWSPFAKLCDFATLRETTNSEYPLNIGLHVELIRPEESSEV